jgi:hypothetical protein
MNRIAAVTFAALALTLAFGAGATMLASPARAEVQYPWCAHYRFPLDAINCGFVNFQQCLATVSGVGGFCYQNPAYPPPQQRRSRQR